MKKFFRLVSMFALAGATLAYTGCTDYDEDINKINDRIDALETGKLKTVEEQVASLQGTVTSLQSAQKAAEDALKALESKHDVDVKNLTDAINGVKGDISTINESLKTYVTKTYADATYATKESVTGALTRIGALETALESVPTAADVQAAKDAADAAQADATEALGDVKALKEALGVYAEAGKLDEALQAKLDITAFDAKFDEQLGKALAEDGKITKAIADAITAATAEINTRIAILQADVKDLANRIQSLVFVPEYSDGKINADFCKLGTETLSENIVVNGTFKVTPAKLAPAVAKYALEGLVNVNAVSVKDAATRSAAEDIQASSVEITNVDAETGRFDVSAVFAADDFDDELAVALYVENPDSELTEGEKEDEKLDTKTYFSSAYVPVARNEVDLKTLIVLATAEEAYEAQDVKKAWLDAPAQVEFMAGYEPRVKVSDDEYITLAAAEKKFALEAGTLVGKVAFAEYKNTDITYTGTDAEDSFVVEDATIGKKVKMSTDKASEAKALIGDKVAITSKLVYKAETDVVLETYVDSYEITRKVVEITVAAYSQPWSYAVADKLSSAHTKAGAYDKALDGAFSNEYKERAVEMNITEEQFEDLGLYDILADEATDTEHKLGDTEIGGDPDTDPNSVKLTIGVKAGLLAKIASVEVKGCKFAKEAQEYHLCNVYTLDAEGVDVKVNFDLTLEAMAADVTVDLGKQTIAYVPAATYYYDFTEEATAKAAFAKVSKYFAAAGDLDAYDVFANDIKAINAGNITYETTKTATDGTESPLTDSYLNPMDFTGEVDGETTHKHYIKLVNTDFGSYDDTYSFETTYETWYGVDYEFTATASIKAPEYGLGYSKELVAGEDGAKYAVLKGEIDGATNEYVIQKADLKDYFVIENFKSGADKDLKVQYFILTEKDSDEGYENLPKFTGGANASETAELAVTDKGVLASTVLSWDDYTARDLKVKAVLYLKGVEVSAKELTLTTADPITKFESKQITVKRAANAAATANLWSQMTVTGVIMPTGVTNLIKQDATAEADMWAKSADAGAVVYGVTYYGLGLAFDEDDFKVEIAGEDVTATHKNRFDISNSVLTYNPENSAELQADVTVKVKAKLTHKFNYAGVEGKDDHNNEIVIEVVFQKPAAK